MKLSPKLQGHLIMLIVMIIFGLNIPINKSLYNAEMLSPYALIALRMSFAAIMFWLVSLFLPKEKVSRRDLSILVVGGISGMLLNQGCFAVGLSMASPVDASIITTSSPLFALIIAAIILKEPITAKKAGGVFVGIIGAVFLVYSSHAGAVRQDPSLAGDLGIMAAQLFYSFYLVITRPLSTRYSPITMMKWMFLTAAIIAFPLFYKDVFSANIFHQDNIEPYLSLAFVLVGATFITYMLIPFAQRRIRATTISMYNNVQPIVASTIAISLGQDRFTVEKLIAAILIFGGVYLVTTSKSREDVENVKTEEIE